MLQNKDGSRVQGETHGMAFSKGVSTELIKLTYSANLGLNPSVLGENVAYGFFPVGSDLMIICKNQLAPVPEINSRGLSIFIEYVFIEKEQMQQIRWNLPAVCSVFQPIGLYRQKEENLPPYILNKSVLDDWSWLENIKRHSVAIRDVLTNMITDSQPVSIVSAPDAINFRINLLSFLINCIPEKFRFMYSFATMSWSTKEVNISFPINYSKDTKLSNWEKPILRDILGSGYAQWIIRNTESLEAPKRESWQKKINLLRVGDVLGKEIIGRDLDQAVEFEKWIAKAKSLPINREEELEKLHEDIIRFKKVLTKDEAAYWISKILHHMMKLSAYELGGVVLTEFLPELKEQKIIGYLADRIHNEIFKQGHHELIVEFIFKLSSNIESQSLSSVFFTLVDEIILRVLLESDERFVGNRINFLKSIKNYHPPINVELFISFIHSLPPIERVEFFSDLLIITPIIVNPVLEVLHNLIKRSAETIRNKFTNLVLIIQYLLDTHNYSPSQLIEFLVGVRDETDEFEWNLSLTEKTWEKIQTLKLNWTTLRGMLSLVTSLNDYQGIELSMKKRLQKLYFEMSEREHIVLRDTRIAELDRFFPGDQEYIDRYTRKIKNIFTEIIIEQDFEGWKQLSTLFLHKEHKGFKLYKQIVIEVICLYQLQSPIKSIISKLTMLNLNWEAD